MFNLKWKQTEEGWIYYMDRIMAAFDARTVSTMGYANISPWLESATKPPAGWSGGRYDSASDLTYRTHDPFGQEIYPPETSIYPGDIPAVSFGYGSAILPKERCARAFVMIFGRIAKKYNLIYFHPRPGCEPSADKSYDYYANASCCPGAIEILWQAPMR